MTNCNPSTVAVKAPSRYPSCGSKHPASKTSSNYKGVGLAATNGTRTSNVSAVPKLQQELGNKATYAHINNKRFQKIINNAQ